MSNTKSLTAALERLSKMNANPKSANAKYFQCKEGKNNVLVLPISGDPEAHPFAEWWVHKGLVDPAKPWIAIACDKNNEGGECVICDMVQTLKDKNFKGNEEIWKPLEAVKEMYSPVIDLDDIDTGVQWWSYGKSISGQLEMWLRNLEDEEKPFYDPTAPQKLIVTYAKANAPKDKYKLDKKNLKPIDPATYVEWFEKIKPIEQVRNNKKTADEKEEILGNYIHAREKVLKSMTVKEEPKAAAPAAPTISKKSAIVEEDDEVPTAPVATPAPKKSSKLSQLQDDDEQ